MTRPSAPVAAGQTASAATARGARSALVFIGFMGAGKSTAAAEVAKALGARVLDSDSLLEGRFGRPLAEQFELHGESAFRAAEEELVCELLSGADSRTVLSLGGGSVLSERVRSALADHVTVLLDIDPLVAWGRVAAGDGEPRREAGRGSASSPNLRPLARDRSRFLALAAARQPLYEQLADAFLPGEAPGAPARALADLRRLARAPRGTRLVWASAASEEYPVLIGRGLLRAGGGQELEEIWPLERSRSRPFCVSDETVSALYGGRLGGVERVIAIPPGERHKTLASAERVWRGLIAAGMTRADHLVALGGGVVGDLAGFCAATYQRGVRVVHVPTTLLAQVDSAYGGKTGVDLPEAKNYVGAYHQPAGVLAEPGPLATLPAGELSAGWVEVLKTALITGGPLWESVSADLPVDERTILACARAKLAIVACDERDAGRRQVLNLGHTVGHAIEAASAYARYRHGEAVGLGLLATLRLSGQERLRERVHELLLAHGLPVLLRGVPVDLVVDAIARDKKRLGSTVPFVLVHAPGDARTGCEVAAE